MTLFLVMTSLCSVFVRRKDWGFAVAFGLAALWFLMQSLPTLVVGGN